MKHNICPFCKRRPDYKQGYNYPQGKLENKELRHYLQCDCMFGRASTSIREAEKFWDEDIDKTIEYLKNLDLRIAENERRIAKARKAREVAA